MLDSQKKDAGNKRKEYTAPALEKGLDILEALAKEPEGLTSTEISSRLGRPMGQLFRMLVVLQQRGYVFYQADTERYEMTLKLFDLARGLAPVRRLNLVAAPLMKHLSQEVGQSCHLVIYYEGRGHIVVQQDSMSARVLSVRLGAEAPLLDTCSGHVLLAFNNDADRDEMLKAIPVSHRRPTQSALKKLVGRIRDDGFECIPSAQIYGVQDIGYPVFDHSGRVAAVLVVPFLAYLDGSHPVKLEAAQEAIEETAKQISARLGH
jgi:DNA-binding IclR family transcriptional regulator